MATGGVLPDAAFGSGVTPWAIKSLASDFVSKPIIVILPNNQPVAISHSSNNQFQVVNIPYIPATNPTAKSVGWKEILTQ